MKAKYLDIRNCHALMPGIRGVPFISNLEASLKTINERPGPTRGMIDTLIDANTKSIGRPVSSKRLAYSPLHISQSLIESKKEAETTFGLLRIALPPSLHTTIIFANGVSWKTLIPLQFLLKGWGDASAGYQGYMHSIARNMENTKTPESYRARLEAQEDEYYYVGITSRNWLLRLNEHLREISSGSRKRFHAAWRDSLGLDNVLFVSALSEVNLTYEGAMHWEEATVRAKASDKYGLNMIPGGFEGLKLLHKLKLTTSPKVSLEEREKAIDDFIAKHPRRGIPNPFIAALWKDDAFYERVMGSRAKTLSRDQVMQIRELNSAGRIVKEIVREVRALNDSQVRDVLLNRTYNRYR